MTEYYMVIPFYSRKLLGIPLCIRSRIKELKVNGGD